MGKLKFMTKEIERAFDRQGDTSMKSAGDIKVIAKWFNPTGVGTWYCYEYDKEDNTMWCFANLGMPEFAECGKVSIDEMKSFKDSRLGVGIERDNFFPIGKYTLAEVRDKIKSGGHL